MDRPAGTDDTLLATQHTQGDDARGDGAATPPERYRLDDLIGRGGMGEVISARDQQIGRFVAVKRLRGETSDAAVARFVREARIQGQLDHPAIVHVHELGRDDRDRPYFVMKRLAGVTLAEVLAAPDQGGPKFTRQRLLRAFVDVCLAIEFAHTRNIIHRDLKPANIMLGDFGEVYVLDWGIARVIGDADHPSLAELQATDDAATVAGAILGTPGYMSPEQLRGETDLDGRTDVFALGCVLFEILAGVPLHARGVDARSDAAVDGDARPSQRAPDREIAPELDELCVAATRRDRAERLPSARELGERVQRFLDGDRDLALRRGLARDELESARRALERGTTEDRRAAFQAATRALALDPHAPEPGRLIGALMLEVPAETPPEVERELDDGEREIITRMAKSSIVACTGYATLVPLAYLSGIDDPMFLISCSVLLGAILAVVTIAGRRPDPAPLFRLSFLLNCALIGVVAQATGPFFLAPAMVALTVSVFAPQARTAPLPLLLGGGLAALLVPLGLELLDVLPRRFSFTPTALAFDPVGAALDASWVTIAMALFCVGVVLSAALLARDHAMDRDALHRKVRLHAWQIRQLLMPSR